MDITGRGLVLSGPRFLGQVGRSPGLLFPHGNPNNGVICWTVGTEYVEGLQQIRHDVMRLGLNTISPT
jgi:hypothetical protein